MRRVLTKISSPFLKQFVKFYFKKPRGYNHLGVKGVVLPTVFFPHFTHSTQFFMDFMNNKKLTNTSILELGCGTGLISVLCAKKGAAVTATDINPKALENVLLNAEKNNVSIHSIQSDLFDSIPKQHFDYILINPPYYPKQPLNMAERAWYCGEDFAYFKKLTQQLGAFLEKGSTAYIILSEDCAMNSIKNIAAQNALQLNIESKRKKWGEWISIYRITKGS